MGGDDRMRKIGDFHDTISLAKTKPHIAMKRVNECIQHLEEQGLDWRSHLASILHIGYQICLLENDEKMAHSFRQRELALVKNNEGNTSYRALDLERLLLAIEA